MTAKQGIMAVAAGLLVAAVAAAQQGQKISVPLTDPARPATVKGSLINGGFHVTGYDGKQVIVEVSGGEGHAEGPKEIDGLKRIDVGTSGVTVTEHDNVVEIGTDSWGRNAEVAIQVPYNTSLKLNCVNGGNIAVEHVSGEIDANNTNGKVTLTDVSGSVVAHALNSNVVVTFDQVAPDKPMAFSSLNGDIDVTLPATTKARIKVKSQNGGVYTDFDIASEKIGTTSGGSRDARGRYRASLGTSIVGTINGGGPELTFTTLNGKVFIRKKK